MSATDSDLIHRYTRENADDAFSEIVQRHLGIVYSAALRQLCSPHLAEEAAQSAFIDLARQAATLKPDTILSAWLYRVTRRKAVDILRRESSRQAREQIASQLTAMNGTPDDWSRIEPFLDEAMDTLDETDRAAIILRYFENKSLRDVGVKLGATENAAQKRLTRAVDRLRDHFSKRGITVGAGALVAVISGHAAAQAAPIALAATITSAAAVTAASVTTTTTAAATLTAMHKTIIATLSAGAITVGVVEEARISSLREQTQTLVAAQSPLIARVQDLESSHATLTNRLTQVTAENQALNTGGGELHRLRAETVRLRGEVTRLGGLASQWGKDNEALRLQMNDVNEKFKVWAAHKAEAQKEIKPPLSVAEQCINNLRQIDGATEQWALENKKPGGAEFLADDIKLYILGQKIPNCPSGGMYAFGKVDMPPTCTFPGHTL